jgi:hydrogenase maturation protein HypF
MFRNMKAVELHAAVDSNEAASLQSWRRPIVLLERKSRCCSPLLPGNISSGLNLVGVMLPYMPFHYQLFQQLKTDAIVLTSGNLSSEPILIDNQAAISRFSARMDMMVLHNRDIHNRTDDSVVRIIAGRERLFRRSRGYVPAPVHTTLNTDGILAFGAELTNCFAIGKGKKIFLSQHIGDLQGFETTLFYEQTIQRFLQLFRMKPTLLAVDMHPEYISTKTARNFGELPLVRVQHHHAHIAGCMAEHCLDEPVIGIAFDGTGYGDDGCIWGAEFFSCTLLDYKRLNHFEYLPLPGGDHAAEEPWRMAVSVLYKTFGKDFRNLDLPLFREVDPENIELLVHMIDRNINCPLTSGAGRLFDAVSSLLGLCQVASFQAEGPMKLESQVLQHCHDTYPYDTGQPIGFGSTIRGIVADIQAGTNVNIIASKFHNTIITVIFETALNIREKEHLNKVVLSGGVFQNKYLLEHAVTMLEQAGFEVYTHMRIPTNDGGIALGQLAVASKRRSMSCV